MSNSAVVADPVRTVAPRSVLDGAQAATKVLGEQVVKGNFSYAFQHMYPRYRHREAKRAGGEELLMKKFLKVPEDMRKRGITLLSYEAARPTAAHEVHLARGVNQKTGEPFQMFLEWVVFVPTTKVLRVIDRREGTPQIKKVETTGFQVAIMEKGSNKWTFIDGSMLDASELRRFFPGLPRDDKLLGLPPVGGRELGGGL